MHKHGLILSLKERFKIVHVTFFSTNEETETERHGLICESGTIKVGPLEYKPRSAYDSEFRLESHGLRFE